MRTFKERIEQYEQLKNKLLLSFRTNDNEYIESVLTDIKSIGISLSSSKTDYLFHFFSSQNPFPDPHLFFLLINLKCPVTHAACNKFIEKWVIHNDLKHLSEEVKLIADYYIYSNMLKKKKN